MTEIHIHGASSIIKGEHPKTEIRAACSYPVQGAQFSKAYRKGLWDGRKNLYNPRTGAFPTGLLPTVKTVMHTQGVEYTVIDHRVEPAPAEKGFELEGVSFDSPYDYQLTACEACVEHKQGIIKAATGAGKSEIACAVTQYLGLPTLFIVGSQELLFQAQSRFAKRLGVPLEDIGIVGAGHWNPKYFTIGMMQTLESRLNETACMELLRDTQVLWVDEAHHTGSDTWFNVLALCPAYYRFALSGTPLDRTDGANLRLIAATGEIIYEIRNKELVERGITARANIIFDKVTEPVLKKRVQYASAYKQGVVENPQLLRKVVEWTRVFREEGLQVLILCEEIGQGNLINDALWTHPSLEGAFIPHQFIHGSEDDDIRKGALASFSEGNLPVLVASRILDEGVDCQNIDALILAGSRKSTIKTLQRLGRGLRGSKLIAVEFANFCHKHLLKHSHERLSDYKVEECFPIHYSAPDQDLVHRLWHEGH